jgi:hypothetical protein
MQGGARLGREHGEGADVQGATCTEVVERHGRAWCSTCYPRRGPKRQGVGGGEHSEGEHEYHGGELVSAMGKSSDGMRSSEGALCTEEGRKGVVPGKDSRGKGAMGGSSTARKGRALRTYKKNRGEEKKLMPCLKGARSWGGGQGAPTLRE